MKSLIAFAHRLGYLPFDVGAPIQLPKIKDTLAQRILSEEDVLTMLNREKHGGAHGGEYGGAGGGSFPGLADGATFGYGGAGGFGGGGGTETAGYAPGGGGGDGYSGGGAYRNAAAVTVDRSIPERTSYWSAASNRQRGCRHHVSLARQRRGALMSRLLPRQIRRCFGLVGLLIAISAIVSQLTLGAIVLPDNRPADPVAALSALNVLCQTGHPIGDKPAPARRVPQVLLCPLSVTLALPAAISTPAALLPAPPTMLVLRIALPPHARAPPSPKVIAAYPRGPPVLV